MKNTMFGKFMIVACLLQLVLVMFVPNKWVVMALLVVINLVLYYRFLQIRRWIKLSDQQMIRISASVAQENSKYLSEKSPSMIFIYDGADQVTWMNQNALAMLHKYSQDFWEEYLLKLVQGKKNQGELYLPDDVVRYSFDREKRILFLYNITDMIDARREVDQIQPAIGLISIDNYDDVVDKMDDKEISYLNSFVTTFISDWVEEYQIYFKRLNAERYFFAAHSEDIRKMEADEFSLVERMRKAASQQELPLTLSMGISYGMESLERIGEVAQNCLDIALVRGGDQVVLQPADEKAKPKFFGGNTASSEKRTRVRSRAMSTALKRIFTEVDDIYIMGHRYPDMDAIGSAFGVSCLASFQNKVSHIVINEKELIPDVERCLAEIHKHPELEERLLTVEQAMGRVKKNSLLVMVDYHKPSLSISQELYDKFEKVAIIDHHRRGDEFPSKPLLNYIESSASSASELVSELIQYESNNEHKLDKTTASLLLAGIFVDTKNFMVRTSSRTFDVSSYLKNSGADTGLVQYLLSSDLTSFLEISELIAKSEFLSRGIVIACAEEGKVYDSVTAAKTADTLLSMNDIEASFVITKRSDGLVGISARSNGKINVQKIMENLGGGGHFTNAATQIKDKSLNEVKSMLYNELEQVVSQS